MPVEKAPVFGIENKYVDALLATPSHNIFVELSLLTIISRFGEIDVEQLTNILGFDRVQIEVGLYRLVEIGFLKKCEFTITN